MLDQDKIFFIGPGGVGKSTVGALVAEKLGYACIDIDLEFCKRIALIPHYVRDEGYAKYCEASSTLTEKLLEEFPTKTILITPSGFLVHEESPHLVQKHLEIIKQGTSVLLLPSTDINEATNIVVSRQLSRWDDTNHEREEKAFRRRFPIYSQYGDIQIFSKDSPKKIAGRITQELKKIR